MKKVGLVLDAESIEELKVLAVAAEEARFHSIWATELYRTPFQQLSSVALVTSEIKLGTAVALAFVRSPMVTSITSLDLDEISSGRLILGLGTGAKRTNENFHGVFYGDRPVARIRECVDLVRMITSESHTAREIVFHGQFYNINTRGYKRVFKPFRKNIPIFMAGIGSNMVRAAAKIADGYIGHVVCSLEYIKQVVSPLLEEELESRKENGDFIKCSIITCAVSPERERAREAARATVAFYATVKAYDPPFMLHGFTEEVKEIRDAFRKKDIPAMIKGVSDEMVETFAIFGDAAHCREKVEKYRKYIDLPVLSAPHYFLDFREVKKYQERLIDAFAS
ncbi:MAG: LLM class flavin-dependent oxidoreductase [Candidatus Dadabacteria bacterium]|nr:LLM class flavin-dependent oxidoreductase [Candidatus Dadabacteria bacterium]